MLLVVENIEEEDLVEEEEEEEVEEEEDKEKGEEEDKEKGEEDTLEEAITIFTKMTIIDIKLEETMIEIIKTDKANKMKAKILKRKKLIMEIFQALQMHQMGRQKRSS